MRKLWALAGVMAVAALSGCGKGASAPAREHAEEGSAASSTSTASSQGGYERRDAAPTGDAASGDAGATRTAAREDTPLWHGEPLWADNRRHSARENAEYQCEHHGTEFGAKGYDDCLAKVHAFIKAPPAGAETVTRGNGDKLIYDAKSNTFAVARRDGAPRTMRKPEDGAAFWAKQKQDLNAGGRRRSAADEERGSGGT